MKAKTNEDERREKGKMRRKGEIKTNGKTE